MPKLHRDHWENKKIPCPGLPEGYYITMSQDARYGHGNKTDEEKIAHLKKVNHVDACFKSDFAFYMTCYFNGPSNYPTTTVELVFKDTFPRLGDYEKFLPEDANNKLWCIRRKVPYDVLMSYNTIVSCMEWLLTPEAVELGFKGIRDYHENYTKLYEFAVREYIFEKLGPEIKKNPWLKNRILQTTMDNGNSGYRSVNNIANTTKKVISDEWYFNREMSSFENNKNKNNNYFYNTLNDEQAFEYAYNKARYKSEPKTIEELLQQLHNLKNRDVYEIIVNEFGHHDRVQFNINAHPNY